MATRVHIDGAIRDERATVSVFDRGFLYGDSVYEVTRTAGGRPVDLPRHLDRLRRSAAALGFAAPADDALRAALAETLAAAANPDAYIRIIVTRGDGDIGLDPALAGRPRLVIIVKPLVLPAAPLYRDGVEVALVAVQRTSRRALDPAVKSGNYLNNVMALAEARRSAAHEAIMLNPEGWVVEGSTSNVFLVRAGRLVTPQFDDGLLDGITRRRVLELALEAGVPTDEAHVAPADLCGADEVFLTSSVRGVLPVARVDGRAIGEGGPGPLTRELMARYEAFLRAVAEGN